MNKEKKNNNPCDLFDWVGATTFLLLVIAVVVLVLLITDAVLPG